MASESGFYSLDGKMANKQVKTYQPRHDNMHRVAILLTVCAYFSKRAVFSAFVVEVEAPRSVRFIECAFLFGHQNGVNFVRDDYTTL